MVCVCGYVCRYAGVSVCRCAGVEKRRERRRGNKYLAQIETNKGFLRYLFKNNNYEKFIPKYYILDELSFTEDALKNVLDELNNDYVIIKKKHKGTYHKKKDLPRNIQGKWKSSVKEYLNLN